MPSLPQSDSFNALLLAAGLGTRLKPITDSLPKCLVPILGKPLLGYWLDLLEGSSVSQVFVNRSAHAEQVARYLESQKRSYAIESVWEKELRGTAGTLKSLAPKLRGKPVLLVHSDNLSAFDMGDFFRAHKSRPDNCAMTMMTFTTDTPESCGIVETDVQGRVTNFFEKVSNPPGRLANGAVYFLEDEVLDFVGKIPGDFVDFSVQVIPYFCGRIFTFHNSIYHRDIGNPDAYEKAQSEYSSLVMKQKEKRS